MLLVALADGDYKNVFLDKMTTLQDYYIFSAASSNFATAAFTDR